MGRIEDIKSRLSMTAVLDALGVSHEGEGANIICPFHAENRPSCTVHADHLYCHSGCGNKDIVDLWQHLRGADFKQALDDLGDMAGVPKREGVDVKQAMADFCRERHLRANIITAAFGLELKAWRQRQGARRRPAILAPTVLGVDRVRYLDRPMGDEPKAGWAKRGGKAHWYGLDQAKQLLGGVAHGGPLYIVNGEPSVWASYQSGIAAVCAAAGEGKTPAREYIKLLAGLGVPIRVVFDLDDAGRKGAWRCVSELKRAGLQDVKALELPSELGEKSDVDDLHRKTGDSGLREALAQLEVMSWQPPKKEGDGGSTGESRRGDGRPKVELSGDLQDKTRAVMDWLVEHNDPPQIFVRGRDLVRVVNERGSAVVELLNPVSLRSFLSSRVRFMRRTESGAETIDPPVTLFQNVLAQELWPFPALEEVLRSPVFSSDGRMIVRDGYCEEVAGWVSLGGLEVGTVAACPAREEVAAAVRLIMDDLFVDFPFADDASKAGAVALGLLPFVRPMIRGLVPLHVVNAPTEGTGKSLLSQSLCIVATGDEPTILPPGKDDDEWRKRITATLERSPSVILMDNLPPKKPLDSPSLASALTATMWTDRRLGSTELVSVRNRAVWVATGNNPRLSGELIRRAVWIRLDSKTERPWERREFRHSLPMWAHEARPALVRAFLTLVQAWIAEGQPAGDVILGSFSEWSQIVGGILDVAGIPGFLDNRHEVYETQDTESAAWREFFEVWWDRYGKEGTAVDSKTLWELASKHDCIPDVLGDKTDRSQRHRLAKVLPSIIGKPYGRYMIARKSKDGHRKVSLFVLVPALRDVPRGDDAGSGAGNADSQKALPAGLHAGKTEENHAFAGSAGSAGSVSHLPMNGEDSRCTENTTRTTRTTRNCTNIQGNSCGESCGEYSVTIRNTGCLVDTHEGVGVDGSIYPYPTQNTVGEEEEREERKEEEGRGRDGRIQDSGDGYDEDDGFNPDAFLGDEDAETGEEGA